MFCLEHCRERTPDVLDDVDRHLRMGIRKVPQGVLPGLVLECATARTRLQRIKLSVRCK